MKNVKRLAQDEDGFKQALLELSPGRRTVLDARDPKDEYVLDPANPVGSVLYYYQVRNNATHRGKAAAYRDFPTLLDSVSEMLEIFCGTLRTARNMAGQLPEKT